MLRLTLTRPRTSGGSAGSSWVPVAACVLAGVLMGPPCVASDEAPAPAGGSTFVPSREVDRSAEAKALEEQRQLDREELDQLVRKIIFSIMEIDGDTLASYGRLPGRFQSDVMHQAAQFLGGYASRTVTTSKIEPQEINLTSKSTAKVMLLVELATVDAIGGLSSAKRTDIWRFEKVRGTWYLLFD